MKKVILTAVAALAFGASSFAQSATAPAPTTAPAKAKMAKVKPAMQAPAAQGVPAAIEAQGAPAAEKVKGQHGEGKPKPQAGMNALGLSPEQETQFKSVNQAHKTAVKAVQMDASLAADAKKAQIAALTSKYESDVQGVMNADQFAKWTAMRAKRSERKADDHKGGNHKKGEHKADGAEMATPVEGTMTPVEAPKRRVKTATKAN